MKYIVYQYEASVIRYKNMSDIADLTTEELTELDSFGGCICDCPGECYDDYDDAVERAKSLTSVDYTQDNVGKRIEIVYSRIRGVEDEEEEELCSDSPYDEFFYPTRTVKFYTIRERRADGSIFDYDDKYYSEKEAKETVAEYKEDDAEDEARSDVEYIISEHEIEK